MEQALALVRRPLAARHASPQQQQQQQAQAQQVVVVAAPLRPHR